MVSPQENRGLGGDATADRLTRTMSDVFQILQMAAESRGLDFLLIGGHAVNAHGYARTTLDVDLLARESQREEWKRCLAEVGYRLIHETTVFAQFDPVHPGEMNLDLMFVDEPTFAKLLAGKTSLPVGGSVLPVAGVLHLIALKLHALRSETRSEGKDFYDVVNLMRLHQIDPTEASAHEILERYATTDLRQRLLAELARPPGSKL